MGNKTYIWLTLGITLLVYTSAAKTKAEEKPSVQSREANQIDQNSESIGNMKNTVRGLVTDKLGRPRGNVYIAPQPTNIWEGIRSDTQGRFILEDVKPGQKNWIAFSQASQAIGLFTVTEDYAGQQKRKAELWIRMGRAWPTGRSNWWLRRIEALSTAFRVMARLTGMETIVMALYRAVWV